MFVEEGCSYGDIKVLPGQVRQGSKGVAIQNSRPNLPKLAASKAIRAYRAVDLGKSFANLFSCSLEFQSPSSMLIILKSLNQIVHAIPKSSKLPDPWLRRSPGHPYSCCASAVHAVLPPVHPPDLFSSLPYGWCSWGSPMG